MAYDQTDTPDGTDPITQKPCPSTKLVFTDTFQIGATGITSVTNSTGNTVNVNFPPFYDTKETSDPRDFRYASDWINLPSNKNTLTQPNKYFYGANSSGSANPAGVKDLLTGIVGDPSKLAWPDVSATTDYAFTGVTDPREDQNAGNIVGFPGIGWLSVVPTNCESSGTWNGNVFTQGTGNLGNQHLWRTLSLEPSATPNLLPDWLMLEAFALAYDSTFLSQTQGKININPDIQPFTGVDRLTPLKALLIPSYDNLTGTSASTIATDLAKYTGATNKGAQKYNLPTDIYLYPSEICEVPSMGSNLTTLNQFQREALARDTVGLMTTQCSDFKVYVVAQSLAKNTLDATQAGPVLSEQRLESVVSRTVDVGPDGIPGTADDPPAISQDGTLETLKFDGTDKPLLGLAGAPSFQYQITDFKFLTH
jgi:hypothetical protein